MSRASSDLTNAVFFRVHNMEFILFKLVLFYCNLFCFSNPLYRNFRFEPASEDHLLKLQKIRPHLNADVTRFSDFARDVHKNNRTVGIFKKHDLGERLSGRCSACVLLVGYEMSRVRKYKTPTDLKGIEDWIANGCQYFGVEPPEVCKGGMKIFGDEIIEVFSQVDLPPQQICGVSLPDICGQFHHLIAIAHQWNVQIPPEANATIRRTPKVETTRLKVLHLSDVHIDIKYTIGAIAKCDKPICCRDLPATRDDPFAIVNPMTGEAEALNNHKVIDSRDKAMKWGDHRNCDLPWWTFDNLLQQISDNVTSGVQPLDYILFTGDIPAHDLWAQSKKSQLELLFNVSSTIAKYFPNTPVFPAVGNHDSFPANNFPPEGLPVDDKFKVHWLYSALAKAWSPWLPKMSLETVKKGGYYTVLLKPGFRIVSLNTNFCYSENLWLWLDPRDPAGMLAWFVDVLAKAEQADEIVQVIGHVPPGRDPECLRMWSQNYMRIVQRFRHTISAQFFGHTHYDEVAVFYDDNSKEPISTAYLAPSLTPYTGMKPSFRWYDIEGYSKSSSWSVLNHQTFVLDLYKANSKDTPEWELEYDACRAYNLSILSNKAWGNITRSWIGFLDNKATELPPSLQQYIRFYMKTASASHPGNMVCKTMLCVKNIVCDTAKNINFPSCRYGDAETTKLPKIKVC